MFVPTGTFVSVKAPFTPLIALTSGEPDTVDAQLSQETPGVNACTGAFGTYTRTFGSGSVSLGAYTVPVSVVVTPAVAHVCCCRQSPVHEAGTLHTFGDEAPHCSGWLHVPHWRSPPHPSAAAPQLNPRLAHVFGTHCVTPQTLAVPPPPQVSGSVQPPHWRVPPQPSPAGPQLMPSWAQVFGVQVTWPQTLAVPPPPQVSGSVHVPHWRVPPQPSPAGPQLMPSWAQVFGVHEVPQTLAVPPPPQVSGSVHVPHWIVPPQPSPAAPQLKPSCAHVFGVQTEPHWPAFGNPHTWPAPQVPHWSVPLHPSLVAPQV
jgi:hypothetical protein